MAEAAALAFLGETGGDSKNKKKKKKGKKGKKVNAEASGEQGDAPPAPQSSGDTKPAPATEMTAEQKAAAAAAEFLGSAGDTGGGNKKKKKKKGKKGGGNAKKPAVSAMAKRIQEQQARQKAEEEALRKAKEEEERLVREEEERLKAIEDAKREKRRLKKERQKELKAKGLIKTKAEKEREAKAMAARQRMIDAGMISAEALEEAKSGGKKKKVVYTKKKKHQQSAAQKKAAEERKRKEEEALRKKKEEEDAIRAKAEEDAKNSANVEEEDSDDDWENFGDSDVEEIDQLKDDWDDDSDEELKEEAAKKKAALKAKAEREEARQNKPEGEESEEEEDDDDLDLAREKREARRQVALQERSKDDLRSPILCVLGHVDTGKTKLLDKIRRTNVQDGEAGGITQQIGATYMPMDQIKIKTQELNKDLKLELKVPGLLVIDTPGHESFTNLRSRGSGLCDIAILVVDIMHGLEPQTIESINLLRSRKTPFIVALNKVDRLYDWKVCKNSPIRKALAAQKKYVIEEFENRSSKILGELMEQGLNAALYYDNDDYRRVVSVVPTSAMTGEGVPDLLLLAVQLTQELMTKKIMYSKAFECTCLEVKAVEGLGTTIDVILINGLITNQDYIVVCGTRGPIVTKVRALLTPRAMRELRVKNDYEKHKQIKAAMGIKISAQNLDTAVAGTNVLVYREKEGDNLEELKMTVQEELESMLSRVSVDGRGVYVQASTLGALEALLEFLKVSKIPVSAVSIGPVFKKDVMRASVMLEHKVEYATILAFDVKVDKDATALALELGVKIMTAEIIYHLFDQFTAYMDDLKAKRRAEAAGEAVFPCILAIKPDCIFMKKSPIVLGCDVVEGILKVGTPFCIPTIKNEEGEPMIIGKVASIEKDHQEMNLVKAGNSVAVKFEPTAESMHIAYGRHFDHNNALYSKLSRGSIDALKQNFKDDLEKTDWMLVIKMKKLFDIK